LKRSTQSRRNRKEAIPGIAAPRFENSTLRYRDVFSRHGITVQAYRSVHVATERLKKIVASAYGSANEECRIEVNPRLQDRFANARTKKL